MNPNNFKVLRQDGKIYDMWGLGIIVNRFVPQSPAPIHNRVSISGRDGFIDQGTTYDGKVIDAVITIKAIDGPDYALLRNEVFKIFDSREYFYIIPDEEPGKRYRVKYNSPYSLSRIGLTGELSISFTSNLAYSESLGTTLNPLTMDIETWQFAQGLLTSDVKYIHNTSSFQIYNAGDVEIDPREHFLEISYTGESFYLSIENYMNGDKWEYNEMTGPNDTLTISGVRSLLNTRSSVFSKTNRKLIRLRPGWNTFQLSGTYGDFEIKFNFRHLYL